MLVSTLVLMQSTSGVCPPAPVHCREADWPTRAPSHPCSAEAGRRLLTCDGGIVLGSEISGGGGKVLRRRSRGRGRQVRYPATSTAAILAPTGLPKTTALWDSRDGPSACPAGVFRRKFRQEFGGFFASAVPSPFLPTPLATYTARLHVYQSRCQRRIVSAKARRFRQCERFASLRGCTQG